MRQSLVIGLWLCLWGQAIAGGVSDTRIAHICGLMLSVPSAAPEYAKNGTVEKGFRPRYSRAWYAAALGDVPSLTALLEKDPALAHDQGLLVIAVGARDPGVLETLLSHGANSNADPDGTPLIMYAAACPNSASLLALLEAGANVYAHDKSQPGQINAMAISIAGNSSGPNLENMKLLLAAGYDARCQLAKDMTPLSMAKLKLATFQDQSADASQVSPDADNKRERLQSAVDLLQTAIAIAKARHPEPPKCVSGAP